MNRFRLQQTLFAATTAAALLPAAAYASAPDSASPATTTSVADAQSPAELSEVTVTGIRYSLQSAQTIKQDSQMIVDSIVAEDIGKLPDVSVADALQRIPGVQVAQQNQGGETDTVLIRGLPNVVTTLNGNEIFSGIGRSYAFENMPATAVRVIKVYKTSDASLPLGGIAGYVDMQLFKPFDFPGAKIAGTLTGTYSDYAGHADPSGSLLLSDRWSTGIGDVGALVNFGETAQHYNDSVVWDYIPQVMNDATGTPIRTASGDLIAAPQNIGSNYNIGYRTRPELNWALQWRPNDNTELYLTGVTDWYEDKLNNSFFFSQPVAQNIPPTTYKVSNSCYPDQLQGQFYGQTICNLASATFVGNNFADSSPHATEDWGADRQYTGGVKWHEGSLHLSTEVSRTLSSSNWQMLGIDTPLNGSVTTNWSSNGRELTWNLGGAPQLNPDSFYLSGLFEPWNQAKATENAWRADGVWSMNAGPLKDLQFGVRYADHTADYISGNNGYTMPPNPVPNYNAAFPNSLCLIPGTSLAPTYLSTCRDYILSNADKLRTFYGLPTGLYPFNPVAGNFFDIEEKRWAGYLQTSYAVDAFGIPVNGLVGIRAETLRRGIDAWAYNGTTQYNPQTGVNAPFSGHTSEHVYLPNFSAVVHLTDDLQARFAWAKTVSYPDFAQLNPSLSFTPPQINTEGFGSSGNINLQPTRSDNTDATLEWYFSKLGSLTGGLFYRQINGYVQQFNTREQVDGYEITVSQPESAGSGHLEGVEAAYQQSYSFLPGPWSGLGTEVNYTYITGSTVGAQSAGGPIVSGPLQNVSKNNYNIVLFYEKYGIDARLAYGYRGQYIGGFATPNVAGIYVIDKPANKLDLSIGYDIDEHLTVVVQATNLTGENNLSYWGRTDIPQNVEFVDRTYGLGVRFRF
ncbi:MAG TPA: TonB-dependent receptor [Steroidobacteraceae bacterium]